MTEREPARTFEDLIVWQKAHAYVIDVYRLSGRFPREETYGLTAQLRRAAVSVPANIAEGFKRRGLTDKARFMNIAEASLEESRYYLRLARDLGNTGTRRSRKTPPKSRDCWPHTHGASFRLLRMNQVLTPNS